MTRYRSYPPAIDLDFEQSKAHDNKAAVARERGLRLCPAPIALLFGVAPRRLGREREGLEP